MGRIAGTGVCQAGARQLLQHNQLLGTECFIYCIGERMFMIYEDVIGLGQGFLS